MLLSASTTTIDTSPTISHLDSAEPPALLPAFSLAFSSSFHRASKHGKASPPFAQNSMASHPTQSEAQGPHCSLLGPV